VFERVDPATGQPQRWHEQISFKTLKELKQACSMYGATAAFTQQLLSSVTADTALPSYYWMAIAKSWLSPRDYRLWKTSYTELCKEQADLL
jgi:hypothetical protein